MARKSGWQQFAENFKSAYDTVNEFERAGAERDIMDQEVEEQFDASGASTGFTMGGKTYGSMDDVGLARNKQLSDNYARYGNYEKALDMQTKQADLVERRNQNKMFQDTYNTKIAKLEAGLASVLKTNVGLDNKNKVDEAQGGVKISQAELDGRKNALLLEYSKRLQAGEWKDNPGAGKQFLLEAAHSTGDQQFYTMVSNMDESAINQKLNGAAQLMTSVKVALGKGQAGGQKELMALIDAQDGITGNIRFDTDKSGAVSIVELDQEGNPTNAAPWAGKDWEEFSQNVMKRLDPVTALGITTKQVGVAKDKASVGLINAQTLEALQKASGSGDSEKLNAIKQKAVTDYMNNEAGGYAMHKRKGNMKAAEADLAIFKLEMQNALSGNKKTNTGGLGGSSTGTGAISGSNDKGVLGKLANLSNSTSAGNQESPSVVSKEPVAKKVLTKAQTSELAALDKEITDLQSKVSELSKVRGLKAGGKARNEIQKIRARIIGIEQRKYKIQN